MKHKGEKTDIRWMETCGLSGCCRKQRGMNGMTAWEKKGPQPLHMVIEDQNQGRSYNILYGGQKTLKDFERVAKPQWKANADEWIKKYAVLKVYIIVVVLSKNLAFVILPIPEKACIA